MSRPTPAVETSGVDTPAVETPAVDTPAVAHTAPTQPAPRDDTPQPGRHLVFGIVAIALFMASVDQTIVATALGTIQRDLHAPINWSGWTITIYALGQVLAMPIAGRISDTYGRRRVFLGAVALFTFSSLLCGFAPNIYVLVVLRAIQALGGGAFLPSANGIVSDLFGRDRDRALGMFTSIFPIGAVAGPAMGGFFVDYWSWRDIFLVNVPLGIVLLVLGWRFIPHRPPKPSGRFDIRGVALLGVMLLSIMLGITSLGTGQAKVTDPTVFLPECVGLVALVLFVRHAQHAVAPFIPPRLLYGRGFGVMNLINFMFGCSALGFGALVPIYAQQRYGISSLSGGSLLIARAIGMMCVAALAVLALRRVGCRWPMLVGSVVMALGLLGMAISPRLGVDPYWWLFATAGVTGLGMGTALPGSNNAILRLARDDIAAVSGLRGMFRQSGGIMAVSVCTAVVARSAHPAHALAAAFGIFAGLLVLTLPLLVWVPDQRGRI
jgi:EmrB/QacA subfamily drug resistance transporter